MGGAKFYIFSFVTWMTWIVAVKMKGIPGICHILYCVCSLQAHMCVCVVFKLMCVCVCNLQAHVCVCVVFKLMCVCV